MDAPQSASPSDVASSDENNENAEPADHVPDPSAGFLERKAAIRADLAKARQRPRSPNDQRGEYRGNTSSGSFRPLMYGHKK